MCLRLLELVCTNVMTVTIASLLYCTCDIRIILPLGIVKVPTTPVGIQYNWQTNFMRALTADEDMKDQKQVSTTGTGIYTLQIMRDVITCFSPSWWRHQMETFSALLAICAGNSPVAGEFPYKGQWRGALMFSLICARINGWANTREAGDLRRHRAHYDVTVMPWYLLLAHKSTYHILRVSREWNWGRHLLIVSEG